LYRGQIGFDPDRDQIALTAPGFRIERLTVKRWLGSHPASGLALDEGQAPNPRRLLLWRIGGKGARKMLFLLATLAAASATSATPSVVHVPGPAVAPGRCGLGLTYTKEAAKPHSGLHRLNEEPPANEYLTVIRMAGGCPEAPIVRTGIGR
jgi:hypothetical protein